MSPLLETICFIDGKAENLEFHEERIRRSIRELLGIEINWKLQQLIHCPLALQGKVKGRFIYTDHLISQTYEPYVSRHVRNLKLVTDETIRYEYKYEDRRRFEYLKTMHSADDLLIVQNGLITDTTFANIILWDGTRWYTPAKPLLKGTKREKLLNEGFLQSRDISPADLKNFKEVRLINAMLNPFDGLPIKPLDIHNY